MQDRDKECVVGCPVWMFGNLPSYPGYFAEKEPRQYDWEKYYSRVS